MSSNRLPYDACAYSADLYQSTQPLSYALNTDKYKHLKPCRMALGIVGGNEVSTIRGNLVDLETELRGTTRLLTSCPALHYNPKNTNGNEMILGPKPCGFEQKKIDIEPSHLATCQMISYPQIPLPPPLKISSCS